jgi:Tfp pilus assembly protein PilF
MRPKSLPGQSLAVLTLAGGLLAVAAFWWLCERSDGVAFLPARAGAEWIVYPWSPENKTRLAVPNGAIFSGDFRLEGRPGKASLSLCAFLTASVLVNGHEVADLNCQGTNWKTPVTAEVSPWLQSGLNEITVRVTNTFGPPGLWLSLQTDQGLLGSDASWKACLSDGVWHQARLATDRPPIPNWSPLYDGHRVWDSLAVVWPLLMLYFAGSGLLLYGLGPGWRRWVLAPGERKKPNPIYMLLALVLIARGALFINDVSHLPHTMGFDAEEHEKYVQYIQKETALPGPYQGWETYQPPLYYAGTALLEDSVGLKAGQPGGRILMQAVNGVVGLAQCWLALLCLELLFPANFSAQAVGLLVAAFLPPHLYLTQYVTNEPLAALCVTAAFYFCLRSLQNESSVYLPLAVGLALGAALLAKVSGLLAAPFFLLALGARSFRDGSFCLRRFGRGAGIAALACLLVCGWYYGWVWEQTGKPIAGNWDRGHGHDWWQDYGYVTSAHYFSFGRSLASPLFSGLHSVGDGIYSTHWGDGLVGGSGGQELRPPWNYDLMNAGYWLAAGITLLGMVGTIVTLVRWVFAPALKWFMVLGLVAAFSLAVVYMSLRIPCFGQAKAFYGLPAFLPFSALVAAGCGWVAQRFPRWRSAVWTLVLVWAMTAFASFWVRGGNAETWRLRGLRELLDRHYAEAVRDFSSALQIKPDDAETRVGLAETLGNLNQPAEALAQYQEALRLRRDSPPALNNAALILCQGGATGRARAVALSKRACELTGYQQSLLVNTLAAVCAAAGLRGDAIAAEQIACGLAAEDGEDDLVNSYGALLKTYREIPSVMKQ